MVFFNGQYFSAIKQGKALLFFLHGYNNTRQEMQPVYDMLLKKCPCLSIYAPEGQSVSSNDSARHSWYQITGFDSEGRRKQEDTPIEEIVQIYNKAGNALAQTADMINADIDNVQKQYGFEDSNTYIAGFSQGAMLALWVALRRHKSLAGCFCLSGLAAAGEYLEKTINAYPKVYLLHGKNDAQVRFKCMKYTQQWLEEKNIDVTAIGLDDMAHTISESELDYLAQVINTDF